MSDNSNDCGPNYPYEYYEQVADFQEALDATPNDDDSGPDK
jgi:hypothetical protein